VLTDSKGVAPEYGVNLKELRDNLDSEGVIRSQESAGLSLGQSVSCGDFHRDAIWGCGLF
jgi:hypothetical protein